MSFTDNMTRAEAIALLGLSEPIDLDGVKKSYRKLCHQVHADKGGTDALFRVVHSAYEVLVDDLEGTSRPSRNNSGKTQSTKTNNQGQQSQPHKRKYTWDEVIRQKNFIVPFDTFSRIVLLGIKESITYEDYNVSITPDNIELHHIKSQFPLKVTVKTWPSWLHALWAKPKHIDEATFSCRNGIRYPDGLGASRYFTSSLTCSVHHGYHEITLEYLGRTKVIKTSTSKTFEKKKETTHTTLRGTMPIYIDVDISLLTKAE